MTKIGCMCVLQADPANPHPSELTPHADTKNELTSVGATKTLNADTKKELTSKSTTVGTTKRKDTPTKKVPVVPKKKPEPKQAKVTSTESKKPSEHVSNLAEDISKENTGSGSAVTKVSKGVSKAKTSNIKASRAGQDSGKKSVEKTAVKTQGERKTSQTKSKSTSQAMNKEADKAKSKEAEKERSKETQKGKESAASKVQQNKEEVAKNTETKSRSSSREKNPSKQNKPTANLNESVEETLSSIRDMEKNRSQKRKSSSSPVPGPGPAKKVQVESVTTESSVPQKAPQTKSQECNEERKPLKKFQIPGSADKIRSLLNDGCYTEEKADGTAVRRKLTKSTIVQLTGVLKDLEAKEKQKKLAKETQNKAEAKQDSVTPSETKSHTKKPNLASAEVFSKSDSATTPKESSKTDTSEKGSDEKSKSPLILRLSRINKDENTEEPLETTVSENTTEPEWEVKPKPAVSNQEETTRKDPNATVSKPATVSPLKIRRSRSKDEDESTETQLYVSKSNADASQKVPKEKPGPKCAQMTKQTKGASEVPKEETQKGKHATGHVQKKTTAQKESAKPEKLVVPKEPAPKTASSVSLPQTEEKKKMTQLPKIPRIQRKAETKESQEAKAKKDNKEPNEEKETDSKQQVQKEIRQLLKKGENQKTKANTESKSAQKEQNAPKGRNKNTSQTETAKTKQQAQKDSKEKEASKKNTQHEETKQQEVENKETKVFMPREENAVDDLESNTSSRSNQESSSSLTSVSPPIESAPPIEKKWEKVKEVAPIAPVKTKWNPNKVVPATTAYFLQHLRETMSQSSDSDSPKQNEENDSKSDAQEKPVCNEQTGVEEEDQQELQGNQTQTPTSHAKEGSYIISSSQNEGAQRATSADGKGPQFPNTQEGQQNTEKRMLSQEAIRGATHAVLVQLNKNNENMRPRIQGKTGLEKKQDPPVAHSSPVVKGSQLDGNESSSSDGIAFSKDFFATSEQAQRQISQERQPAPNYPSGCSKEVQNPGRPTQRRDSDRSLSSPTPLAASFDTFVAGSREMQQATETPQTWETEGSVPQTQHSSAQDSTSQRQNTTKREGPLTQTHHTKQDDPVHVSWKRSTRPEDTVSQAYHSRAQDPLSQVQDRSESNVPLTRPAESGQSQTHMARKRKLNRSGPLSNVTTHTSDSEAETLRPTVRQPPKRKRRADSQESERDRALSGESHVRSTSAESYLSLTSSVQSTVGDSTSKPQNVKKNIKVPGTASEIRALIERGFITETKEDGTTTKNKLTAGSLTVLKKKLQAIETKEVALKTGKRNLVTAAVTPQRQETPASNRNASPATRQIIAAPRQSSTPLPPTNRPQRLLTSTRPQQPGFDTDLKIIINVPTEPSIEEDSVREEDMDLTLIQHGSLEETDLSAWGIVNQVIEMTDSWFTEPCTGIFSKLVLSTAEAMAKVIHNYREAERNEMNLHGHNELLYHGGASPALVQNISVEDVELSEIKVEGSFARVQDSEMSTNQTDNQRAAEKLRQEILTQQQTTSSPGNLVIFSTEASSDEGSLPYNKPYPPPPDSRGFTGKDRPVPYERVHQFSRPQNENRQMRKAPQRPFDRSQHTLTSQGPPERNNQPFKPKKPLLETPPAVLQSGPPNLPLPQTDQGLTSDDSFRIANVSHLSSDSSFKISKLYNTCFLYWCLLCASNAFQLHQAAWIYIHFETDKIKNKFFDIYSMVRVVLRKPAVVLVKIRQQICF